MPQEDFATLAATGFALGWGVAWPPGPINAEMIRRGLARGFWPAYSVGLGASTGDFLWALLVALGAGAVMGSPRVRIALGVVSTLFLLVLTRMFLGGAWRSWKAWRAHAERAGGERSDEQRIAERRALDSSRGGFLLGLGMALSSPWNVAFWIAVIGNAQTGTTRGPASSLLLAAFVVLAAATWGLALCTAVRFGARFATPLWDVVTQGATGVLMLAFAVRGALRLIS